MEVDSTPTPPEAPVFSSPTRLPTNGLDGSLHDTFFFVPSYHVNPYSGEGWSTTITWNMIDAYGFRISIWSVTLGACLGMMLSTLLYVLFITPPAKRWKAFHSSLLTALLLKTTYLIVYCAQISSRHSGVNPAYPIITTDYTFRYSTEFLIWRVSGTMLDLLATISTFVCLFIQAKTTLAGLRLTHRLIYLLLTIYLLLASIACIITRILLLAVQIRLLRSHPRANPNPILDPEPLSIANTTFTALTLGSYGLISLISVLHILWTRRTLLGLERPRRHHNNSTRSTRYDRALALLALILLESSIAPLILALMIALPDDDAGYIRPEILVLPVVLALLPFGGLFSGRDERTAAAEGRSLGREDGKRAQLQQQQQQQGVVDVAYAGAHVSAVSGGAGRHRWDVGGHGAAGTFPELDASGREHEHVAELGAGDGGGGGGGYWQGVQDRKPAAPVSAVDRELAALDAL